MNVQLKAQCAPSMYIYLTYSFCTLQPKIGRSWNPNATRSVNEYSKSTYVQAES